MIREQAMSTVKRTFSIPADLSAELDLVIPNRERAKFIVSSLRDALRKRKRKELLDLLDRIPSKENLDGTQSEDVLREIRSGRADQIICGS